MLHIDVEVVGSDKIYEGGSLIVVSTLIHWDLKKAVDITVERSDFVSHGAERGAPDVCRKSAWGE